MSNRAFLILGNGAAFEGGFCVARVTPGFGSTGQYMTLPPVRLMACPVM